MVPKTLRRVGAGLAMVGVLCAFQRPFRQYVSMEGYDAIPMPPDWQEKAEWVFARLMYPEHPNALFGGWGRYGRGRLQLDWRQGGTSWTQDYPRADRHFVQALRRLTRIQVRSVEEPINLDDGSVYDWPWLYAVQPGHWMLTDNQAKSLREYLQRGGFFMADDFWGPDEWEVFMRSMRKVLPNCEVVELENKDAIFHTVYDLDERYQIASEGSVRAGRSWKCDNCPARWRGIYDDHGRLVVAMTFQSDVGDSWEWADAPYYPEHYAALGIRIGVNYIVYAMTH